MYRKTVLNNGVRLVSETLSHFQSVSLGIWVDVGSRDEVDRENGISHFIEHMIFKGTHNRTTLQIAKELDAIGGLSNAFTGREYTCFHSKVLAKHFHTLGEILSDIFLNSLFNAEDLDRERQVILQEISMVEDTPEDHIHVIFNRHFWPDHPLGMPVLGTWDTVCAIDKEKIVNYIKQHYRPEGIVIAAAGNIEHTALVDFFEPRFGSLQSVSNERMRNRPYVGAAFSLYEKDLEQVHLCLGGEGPHLSSESRYAGAILNTILGGSMSSRLFQEIREKRGLAYVVYSFLSAYLDTGLLAVYIATDPGEINAVIGLISREIQKIQEGMISDSDVVDAREHMIGGLLLGAENMDSRMMRIAKNEYVFGRYVGYDELVQGLEETSVAGVIDVAREIFQGDRISLTTLGPVKRESLDLGTFQFNESPSRKVSESS
jgi:predicted Zn-dependent peptidase